MNRQDKDGYRLALDIFGRLAENETEKSQEEIEAIIQEEVNRGGYTDKDLKEAVELMQCVQLMNNRGIKPWEE